MDHREFNTKDEAEEFVSSEKERGVSWSNLHEEGGKFHAYYSIVGDLAGRSMREAGEYYNLRVNLDSDYSVGVNWAECH